MATSQDTRARNEAEDFGLRVKAFSIDGSRALAFDGSDTEPLIRQIHAVATCIDASLYSEDYQPMIPIVRSALEAIETLSFLAAISHAEQLEYEARNGAGR